MEKSKPNRSPGTRLENSQKEAPAKKKQLLDRTDDATAVMDGSSMLSTSEMIDFAQGLDSTP